MLDQLLCKFKVSSIKSARDPDQITNLQEIEASAVTGEENEPWSKYTPFGLFKINITNVHAFDLFEPGAEYIFAITKVEKESQ